MIVLVALFIAFLLSGCGPSMAGVMLANPGVVGGLFAQSMAGMAASAAISAPGLMAGKNAAAGGLSSAVQGPASVIAEAHDANLHAAIHSVGSSHWAKDSRWQEVTFTLTNTSSDDVAVMEIRANDHGVLIPQMRRAYSNPADESFDIGKAAQAMLLPGYRVGHEYGQKQIWAEFEKRQVQQATLAPGGTMTGSAFFPAEKTFSEIVFSVLDGERMTKVRVNLNGEGTFPAEKTTADTDSIDIPKEPTEEKPSTTKGSQLTYQRTSSGYEPVE